ncbi:MAG: dehydrogenase, partial [Chloroflexi bacterium]|nr:dehydrogenase [Chloroflexota bacterium]
TIDPTAGIAGHDGTSHVVLECSGQDRGVQSALDLAARHGEVFLIGAAWKRGTAVMAADLVRPIFSKYLSLRSGWEWQIPLYGSRPPGSIAGCTAWILACMRDGSLVVDELITDRVSSAQAPAIYADLLDRPAAHMGVVIDWRQS